MGNDTLLVLNDPPDWTKFDEEGFFEDIQAYQ